MIKFIGLLLLIAFFVLVTLTLLVIKWEAMDRDIQALTADCTITNVASVKGVKQNE
jgi:hypothetical protein